MLLILSYMILLAGTEPSVPAAVVEVPIPAPAKWTEFKTTIGKPLRLSSGVAGRWVLVDDTGFLTPSADGKSADFLAVTNGRYRIVVALGDAEPSRVAVTVGDAPLPPGPPVPPVPIDALTARLQAAYTADAGAGAAKDATRKDLAQLWKSAKTMIESKTDGDFTYSTSGQLLDEIKAAAKTLAADSLPGTRAAIAKELGGVFAADSTLTDETRASGAVLFARIAAALLEVK